MADEQQETKFLESGKMRELFGLIVERATARAKSSPIVTSRRNKLPLVGRAEAKSRPLPKIVRTADQIPAELREVFSAAVNGETDWPLFLYGPVGTGKTCGALCLADYAQGWYWRLEDLTTDLADTISSGDYSDRQELWRHISTAPLAVLDEIASRDNVSDHHYQTLKRFWEDREPEQHTIYISNKHPDEIADIYDDRIASRILCGTWHEVRGKDRRRHDA